MKTILVMITMFQLLMGNGNNDTETTKGYVYDKDSNECLTGVRIISDVDTTYTDFDGYYEIKTKSDTSELQYSLISYEKEDFFYKKQ